MASEIIIQTVPEVTGATVNAIVLTDAGKVWDTVSQAFVSYADADFSRYCVGMSEVPFNSGRYVGDFPSSIAVAGTYTAAIYRQLDETPASSDEQIGAGEIEWSGNASPVTPPVRAIVIQTVPADTGLNAQALIFNASGEVWNTVTLTFEAYADANITSYGVQLYESDSVPGLYLGDFPTAITTPGTYSVVMLAQQGDTLQPDDPRKGTDTVDWDGTQVVQPPTSSQLCSVPYAQSVLAIPTTQDANVISQLIDVASAAIRKYCNRDFTYQTYSEYYDGRGESTLTLNQFPVQTVKQVTFYPYEETPTTYDTTQIIVDRRTGRISMKPPTRFPYGFQEILVTYSAGFSSTIPFDIQYACALIVKNLYIQRGTGLLASMRKLGDYQANYVTKAVMVINENFDIAKLLDQYKSWGL